MAILTKVCLAGSLVLGFLAIGGAAADENLDNIRKYAMQMDADQAATYDVLTRACPGYKDATLPKDADAAEKLMENFIVDPAFTLEFMHISNNLRAELDRDSAGFCKQAIYDLPSSFNKRGKNARTAGSFAAMELQCNGYKLKPDLAAGVAFYKQLVATEDGMRRFWNEGVEAVTAHVENADEHYCADIIASMAVP